MKFKNLVKKQIDETTFKLVKNHGLTNDEVRELFVKKFGNVDVIIKGRLVQVVDVNVGNIIPGEERALTVAKVAATVLLDLWDLVVTEEIQFRALKISSSQWEKLIQSDVDQAVLRQDLRINHGLILTSVNTHDSDEVILLIDACWLLSYTVGIDDKILDDL